MSIHHSRVLGTGQQGSNPCPGYEASSAFFLKGYGHLGCPAPAQGIAHKPGVLYDATCMMIRMLGGPR